MYIIIILGTLSDICTFVVFPHIRKEKISYMQEIYFQFTEVL